MSTDHAATNGVPKRFAPRRSTDERGVLLPITEQERLARVVAGFANDGVLVEKYNVDTNEVAKRAGGGEYKLQVGFGWTNGVLAALLARYPVASADTTPKQ